jgi:hypothetical protein
MQATAAESQVEPSNNYTLVVAEQQKAHMQATAAQSNAVTTTPLRLSKDTDSTPLQTPYHYRYHLTHPTACPKASDGSFRCFGSTRLHY